jgi:DNA-directed RNA polymerase specialized sigma24 family protein
VVASVTWDGYRPSPQSASVLTALLRQATTYAVARALLQALLPRLKAERVSTPTYGHGVGQSWPRPADTAADLVAEAFAAITHHAGEYAEDVARLVVREAARRLRTARQAQHRYQTRTVALLPDHAGHTPADLMSARSAPEWLAAALLDVVRTGRLSAGDARLVYAARVTGLPASEVGRRQGMPPKAVYYALARAERAFLAGAGVGSA